MSPLNAQCVCVVFRQPLDDDGVVVAPGVVGQVGLVISGVDHEVEVPGSGDLDQSCKRCGSLFDQSMICSRTKKISNPSF